MPSFLSHTPLKSQDCGLHCVLQNALLADKGHTLQNSLGPMFLLREFSLDFVQKYSSFPGIHAAQRHGQGGLDGGC